VIWGGLLIAGLLAMPLLFRRSKCQKCGKRCSTGAAGW
jgi:hypothetical protein